MDEKSQKLVVRIILYVVLSVVSLIFIMPLIWMISTSLKPSTQIFLWPPRWIPNPVMWNNYYKALTYLPFPLFFKNTMIIAGAVLVGDILSSSFIAYGFARLRFPGRDVLFIILLSTMMLPVMVKLIPMYILFSKLRWVDTFLPLIVPFFFGRAYLIFLLRQFFLTIPPELSDAARIDGCSEIGIWWRVILPLSGPALAVVAIFSFQWTWSDFLSPLVFLNDITKKTMALGLVLFVTLEGGTMWNQMMAIATIMTTPILIIFAFCQRYFIRGVTLTGIKG